MDGLKVEGMLRTDLLDKIMFDVAAELGRGDAENGDFATVHDGFGVLCEEMLELLVEIQKNDYTQQRVEACQVAAMGIKFVRFLDQRKKH